MKTSFFPMPLALLMALTLLMGSSCEAQPNSKTPGGAVTAQAVQTIDPASAATKIAQTPELQILDVRTPEEVAGGVIQGAAKINWFDADFAAQATKTLDKNRPILVYCKVGGRSTKAADALVAQGFTSVFNLEGGITRWEAENHPLQK